MAAIGWHNINGTGREGVGGIHLMVFSFDILDCEKAREKIPVRTRRKILSDFYKGVMICCEEAGVDGVAKRFKVS